MASFLLGIAGILWPREGFAHELLRVHSTVDTHTAVFGTLSSSLCSNVPPPQTQEARTVREMWLRSSGVERSLPGVWGRVCFNERRAMIFVAIIFFRLNFFARRSYCFA